MINIFTREEFIFDGEKSSDYGVSIVRTDSGLFPTVPWMGSRNLVMEKVPYKDMPFYYRTDLENLEFEITISLLDENAFWDSDTLQRLGKWLLKRKPCEFITCDDMRKRYMVVATSNIEVLTNGLLQGYATIVFRSVLPYALSPVEISTYDLSATNPNTIEIYNPSNVQDPYNEYRYYPELYVDLKSNATSITIINNSDGGRGFSITNLSIGESLYVNNQLKYITSSTNLERLPYLYNYQWLSLVYGVNRLTVLEPCVIQFKTEYPVYF